MLEHTNSDIQSTTFQCAWCGENNETLIDPSEGDHQQYTEDCQVCCRPNILHIHWDAGSDHYIVRSEQE
jgi:hypothetical protein